MNFVSKLPWPGDCVASPINPGTDWLRGQKEILPCIRLGFAPGLNRDFLMLAAQKAERIYVADFTLPERNLALPMHFLARLLPGRRDFWRNGALWGLAAQADLEPFYEKIVLGGAGVLAGFKKHNKAHFVKFKTISSKVNKKV